MENLPYLANVTPFLERDKKRGDPLKTAPIAKKFRSSVAAIGHFFMHAPQQIRSLQNLENSTGAVQRIAYVRVVWHQKSSPASSMVALTGLDHFLPGKRGG